ncbi:MULTISPECIES: D-alanine--D-alanine ligase family protein [unclassified Aeromicrobium]|uniref:D-alanine--D-alanine ligase family protein n=1 Tax=unclassified Aeromicrobium TaxID=2633570 RepID=UPI0006F55DBE|nr:MULTISPECIES: D-alanine--D-alanine ligase family protein [unclassified Aeromicrobium]KQP75829.1 D-alanine--D-alanine ligase [Aeromicrobium sp. Leaf289]RYY49974.1 MAG: D-alanine--D-alanine ligase [Actinomycetales bacterium]
MNSSAPAVTPTGDSTARPRVAVVFGGRSSEHGVSCLTARNVVSVIDRGRYDVTTVGITPDGRWVRDDLGGVVPDGGLPHVDPDGAPFAWEELRDVDVVLPLLHGPWGEDGTIQGLLEMAGVRYVGAGVLASSVGMDKPFTKTVFSAAGLPQIAYVTITPRQWELEREKVLDRVRALRLPVFVKPARAGSSSGVTKVDDPSQLVAAVEAAREHDPKVIVEAAAIDKRELEVGVVQRLDGTAEASVVGEVRNDDATHDFYDFEAKYLDGSSANLVPADISDVLSERIRAYAIQAFEALGCEGLARVDFFLTGTAPDGLVVNEINTMPGFTSTSMFPVLWEASGVSYADLVDRLLQLALQREPGLR